MGRITIALLLAAAASASGFSAPPGARALAARPELAVARASAPQPRRAAPLRSRLPLVAKIGKPEDEPDKAFISTWEQKPDSEKIKSPAVLIGLGALVLPFIVGIIVLATGGFGGN